VGTSTNLEADKIALKRLQGVGIKYEQLKFGSAGKNLLNELLGFIQLIIALKKEKPDLVHTVTPKGMIYGGVAAKLAGIKSLVIAISGMGYLYTGTPSKFRKIVLRAIDTITTFILSHPNNVIIVQNKADKEHFLTNNYIKSIVKLIPGSGVHLDEYSDIQTKGNNCVILPARLLVDKGVTEFVHAARKLKEKGINWRFILVGSTNSENPTAITTSQVENWVKKGDIEWYGHIENMKSVYKEADIVCLPSYREGMPKVLLEAAASSKPIITTDTVGCNEAIINNHTGILVPVKNVETLANRLEELILDPQKRLLMGRKGRELAITKFSIETVITETLSIYNLLHEKAL